MTPEEYAAEQIRELAEAKNCPTCHGYCLKCGAEHMPQVGEPDCPECHKCIDCCGPPGDCETCCPAEAG